jgi:hypothetical protein
VKLLIVVPVHDRTEFIGDALDSIAQQTRLPDEVVVTGNVHIPQHPLSDKMAVLSTITEDSLAVRVNRAIKESHCDAFTMLSDDDKIEPNFLERTSRLMERYADDIVYTDLRRFDGATNIMHALPWTEEQIELTTVPFVTSLCTKKRWKIAGGYEDVPFFDWHFWWKCFHTGATAFHLAEPLFLYREHAGQRQYQENLEESRRLLLDHHNRTRTSVQESMCRA